MSESLEFVIRADGTIETIQQLDQVKSKTKQLADETEASANRSRTAQAAASLASAQAFSALGASISNVGSQLAQHNRVWGETLQVIGRTATQVPQLVQQFGAFGAAIGAAELAFAAFNVANNEFIRLQTANQAVVAGLTQSFESLETAIQNADRAQQHFAEVQSGAGSASENQAHRQGLNAAQDLLRRARDGDRAALDQLANEGIPVLGIGRQAGLRTASQAQHPEVLGSELLARALNSPVVGAASDIFGAGAGAALQRGPSAGQQQMARSAAAAILAPLEQQVSAQIDEFQRNIQTQAERRYAESLAGSGAVPAGPGETPTRRGGGGGGGAAAAARQAELESWQRYYAQIERDEQRLTQIRQTEQQQRNEIGHQEQANAEALRQQRVDQERATQEQLNQIYQQDLENRRHQFEQQQQLFEQQKQAAQAMADSITGHLTGALSSSVSAWLDGSKSFEQAMADMAKSVIKSLVSEAIVQTVVETARGIASLASYDYPGAAEHFAAAGTWAAVGVVAGGVGAAAGAFGGGGKSAGASGASHATAPASTAGVGAGAANVQIILFAPNAVVTEAERGQMMARGLRQAQRVLGAGAVRLTT